MQADYWNKLAATFEQEIFEPLANDTSGTILNALLRNSSKRCRIADIGCGTGSLLPTLAAHFQSIIAIDLSERCLEIAEKRYGNLDGIKFLQHDFIRPLPKINQVDVGVCLNVAIMPNYSSRMKLLKNVTQLIRPGGRLVLLIPSMESALLSAHRLVRRNLEEYENYRAASSAASSDAWFYSSFCSRRCRRNRRNAYQTLSARRTGAPLTRTRS